MLSATRRAQKCKIAYIYCAFCNSESSGAPAAEASKSKFATSSYCVLFMFFSFVQLRELSPVYRGSLGAGAPGDSGGQKCKIVYIYCAFCNPESSPVQNRVYLQGCSQFGQLEQMQSSI